jgi:hypothetical protein
LPQGGLSSSNNLFSTIRHGGNKTGQMKNINNCPFSCMSTSLPKMLRFLVHICTVATSLVRFKSGHVMGTSRVSGLLQPFELPLVPWDTVTMDFITQLPRTARMKGLGFGVGVSGLRVKGLGFTGLGFRF